MDVTIRVEERPDRPWRRALGWFALAAGLFLVELVALVALYG